jgi:mono/diheme cytochrome c family protein
MRIFRSSAALAAILAGLIGFHTPAHSAEQPPDQPQPATAAPASGASQTGPEITDAERNEAKAIFAGQCGWCHGSYGMTADKGPKLAGTTMTKQEVEERIRNGKPNYMPSFKRFLNDQQIALMAKYIKSLKP